MGVGEHEDLGELDWCACASPWCASEGLSWSASLSGAILAGGCVGVLSWVWSGFGASGEVGGAAAKPRSRKLHASESDVE
eukprot:337270-Pyramimonas_sp.AAC.1